MIATLKELLAAHKGASPVQVRFHSSQGVRAVRRRHRSASNPAPALLSELRVLLGTEAVRLAPLEPDDVIVDPERPACPRPTG